MWNCIEPGRCAGTCAWAYPWTRNRHAARAGNRAWRCWNLCDKWVLGPGPGDELNGAAPPLAGVAADVAGGEDGTYGPSPGLRERQARRRALEPFGLPTGRLPQANLEPNGPAPAGRPVSFVADDGDESPGDLT